MSVDRQIRMQARGLGGVGSRLHHHRGIELTITLASGALMVEFGPKCGIPDIGVIAFAARNPQEDFGKDQGAEW